MLQRGKNVAVSVQSRQGLPKTCLGLNGSESENGPSWGTLVIVKPKPFSHQFLSENVNGRMTTFTLLRFLARSDHLA
jgi:hypothetical protein